MTRLRQDTGIRGEQIALDYLLGRGYQLVAKNWRCRSGEIDLIMKDGDTMVFIEVKTRRGVGYGLPQEAVERRKQLKIRRLAEYYALISRNGERELRFDVVAITFSADYEPLVEHLEGVF